MRHLISGTVIEADNSKTEIWGLVDWDDFVRQHKGKEFRGGYRRATEKDEAMAKAFGDDWSGFDTDMQLRMIFWSQVWDDENLSKEELQARREANKEFIESGKKWKKMCQQMKEAEKKIREEKPDPLPEKRKGYLMFFVDDNKENLAVAKRLGYEFKRLGNSAKTKHIATVYLPKDRFLEFHMLTRLANEIDMAEYEMCGVDVFVKAQLNGIPDEKSKARRFELQQKIATLRQTLEDEFKEIEK